MRGGCGSGFVGGGGARRGVGQYAVGRQGRSVRGSIGWFGGGRGEVVGGYLAVVQWCLKGATCSVGDI